MQRKKLASSKSKSQRWTSREVKAIERESTRLEKLFGIANGPSVPVEPLSGSDPCRSTDFCYDERHGAPCPLPCDACDEECGPLEVVITKNSGFWCTMFGSHKSRILDEDKKPFPDRDDPLMVAKYLASHARGPINVIWW